MIRQFEHLTAGEQQLLLKAPALVSVFISCTDGEVNATQKKDALRLAHLKTFTAAPILLPYYREVEKTFQQHFEAAEAEYSPFSEEQRNKLLAEINKVSKVLEKLEDEFGQTLAKSFHKYANHVKKSTHSVFQDFLIPLRIPGLND